MPGILTRGFRAFVCFRYACRVDAIGNEASPDCQSLRPEIGFGETSLHPNMGCLPHDLSRSTQAREAMGASNQTRRRSTLVRCTRSSNAAFSEIRCVAAYALSPVDLIPDFIPVLGYLDDLVIVPLGILLAVRLVPPALMHEFRERATAQEGRPSSRGGLVAIQCIWLVVAALAGWVVWRMVSAES